jgi:two-component system cell cycle sensor histidine kinase/response regulator CckA
MKPNTVLGGTDKKAAAGITRGKDGTDSPLPESAERYRSLVEDTSDGFYAFNAVNGRFVFLNRRGCDLLGYSLQEAGRLKAWEVVVPAEQRRFKEDLRARLKGESPKPDRQLFTALRKDLSTLRVELSMEVVGFRGQPFVQGVLRDVTDYEQFKKQIDHFQRLETIATMVGGLSNQFGNALTVIRSNVTLLEQLCAGEKQPARHLAQIRGALHRLDGLTHYMLAFARGGDPRPEAISLNNFVTKILSLISYSAPYGIRFMTKLSADLPLVRADTTHLQMVLTAVVANAEEAIEGRGRILITTRKTDPEPVFFDCNADLKPGNYVCLSIADTGKGMDEPTRKRVCEPFFTTKLHSRGLGMAAVYGMVKKQGGWLSIQSLPGRGTTVSIYLLAQDAESNT